MSPAILAQPPVGDVKPPDVEKEVGPEIAGILCAFVDPVGAIQPLVLEAADWVRRVVAIKRLEKGERERSDQARLVVLLLVA
jgi:hypothetical protein